MADRLHSRLATALLVAAAPVLVLAGMWATSGSGASAPMAASAGRTASSVPGAPAAVPPTARPAVAASTRARPDTVVVPALDIRAEVFPIATQGGTLTPPSDPRDVGWWSGGSRPGSRRGAAVITGHTVHTGGGAFDDLDDLDPGDRVLVLAGRRTVSYDVSSVRVLSRAALARESARIFARSGPARLVMITCEGWDGAAYRSNVVVTARPA